ncbi:MAG TPA: hypothetical protein VKT81_17420 [Bryobacteraceae bacterium]|nr:hypothetical protein [Bryobacteraceae bacterium]
MTRKLVLLDVALAAVLGFLIWQMRAEWIEAHARSRAFLATIVKPSPPPRVPAVPRPSPLAAMTYAEVAQLNLFSKDRNPQVILDPVAPPKEKPVPAFPVARGVLLWEGTPPVVMLSMRPGGPQRGYRMGDRVGEWKIVSVDSQYITFEWDGKEFKKRIDELMDRTAQVAEAAAPAQPATPNAPSASKGQSLSDANKSDHWVDVGASDMRGCKPGDDSATGTVIDGFKKVVSSTPFGSACRWEQVK